MVLLNLLQFLNLSEQSSSLLLIWLEATNDSAH